MTTNGVEGEEIPMTGDKDTTTTEETGDQETNIDDDLWDDVFTNVDESETLHGKRFMDSLFISSDDVRDDLAGMTLWKIRRLAILKATESKLSKVFDRDFRGSFGPANIELLKSLRVTDSGLEFTNLDVTPKVGKDRTYVSVIVGGNQGQGLRLATSKDPTKFDKFNKLVERAKVESENKSVRAKIKITIEKESVNEGASTSDAPEVTREATEEIANQIVEELLDQMRISREKIIVDMKKIFESGDIEVENENIRREVNAAMDLQVVNNEAMDLDTKFKTFDIQIKHWKELAAKEDTTPELKELLENVAEFEGLAKDFVRLKVDMTPEMEKTLGIMREKIAASDMLRLERFKKWAKKNMVGLSTGAITIAAFITSIVMASRAALKTGAQGIGRFAKAVGRILKQMGLIFSALGTVIATALSWGAKGIAWLTSNLWVLAIAVAFALYNWYISRGSNPPEIQRNNTYQNYPELGPRMRSRNYT